MTYTIHEIDPADDPAICHIIQSVGAEFGAVGDGFGPSDPEVLCMSRHYCGAQRSRYLIAKVGQMVVGGCGLAPFHNSTTTCELKKLFLLPESRGQGIGRELAQQCLAYAQTQGYTACYLDTLKTMTSAIGLYESLGFSHLDQPLAGTLHNGCDVWMLKQF